MAGEVHVLGIVGSLRKGSYNRALLRAAQELTPEEMRLEAFDLSDIPLFSEDVEAEGWPEPVQRLREKIEAADALLIATPEYNWSIPGVLKNALDWASRPTGNSPLIGKPVAMMGATPGPFGTTRAQMHLRQVFAYNDMPTLHKPVVLVAQAKGKFDEQGRLTDEPTRQQVRQLLEALADWSRRLNRRE